MDSLGLGPAPPKQAVRATQGCSSGRQACIHTYMGMDGVHGHGGIGMAAWGRWGPWMAMGAWLGMERGRVLSYVGVSAERRHCAELLLLLVFSSVLQKSCTLPSPNPAIENPQGAPPSLLASLCLFSSLPPPCLFACLLAGALPLSIIKSRMR